ncbi:ABC transporter permease [Clostridium sp. 19966]|uniref:ABC transporter permease n=1 Tax=Clostridium sp. 19966 TaxID=2768166 RepID=UPI0028DD5E10|nr:ABC transporter permease [Clostridium sp. 19966]MDT8715120.1 ABC transporter permease [Clostridium sp. 19966]
MNFIRIVKFDFFNILRNPALVISGTIFPIIMIAVMGFITTSGYGASSVSSYDYYGITMIIFMALMMAMIATNSFMEEKVKRGNTRIMYAPISKTEIYMSKLLAAYLFGGLCLSLIVLSGQYIFNINFGRGNIGYVLLLVNALTFFGCCLGTLFCCIFKSEQAANSIMQIPILIFTFLGGTFFSAASLGKLLDKLSNVSPLKWVTECAFQIIYDRDFSIYLVSILGILAASMLCILMCQLIFKPEEYV